LLEKTSVGAADLAAVATAVAGAEGGARTGVTDAWVGAAINRAERDVKEGPRGDEAGRRRLAELKALAAAAAAKGR
jgi:hypothetical protein